MKTSGQFCNLLFNNRDLSKQKRVLCQLFAQNVLSKLALLEGNLMTSVIPLFLCFSTLIKRYIDPKL